MLIKEMCRKAKSQMVVCGDFNMKEIDWERHLVKAPEGNVSGLFLDCLDDNFFGSARQRVHKILGRSRKQLIGLDYH